MFILQILKNVDDAVEVYRDIIDKKDYDRMVIQAIPTHYGYSENYKAFYCKENSVDVDLLEKAHRAPEEYLQVIVRKGGYSVRFNEMGERERENFIEWSKAERR